MICLASARLVQRPIMNSKGKDIWQVDAKYTSETYNGFNGFGSLHGNAVYEYQYKNREREFLVLTVDPTNNAICYGIAQIKDGKRVPKEGWSGIYGKFGTGTDRFRIPKGICIQPCASDDRYLFIFVADEYNNRIVQLKYDENLRKITWVGAITTGSLSHPRDVSCQWLDEANGTSLLAVANTNNHRVNFYKIDSDGSVSYLTYYGSNGSGTGQFKNPSSVALCKDAYTSGYGYFDLFVADCGNERLVKVRCTIQGSGSNHSFQWSTTKAVDALVFTVAAIGSNEKVVFLHEFNNANVKAYDYSLEELLYTTPTSSSRCQSFYGGESVISESWSYNTGLKYYWLDSEFKEAGAVPNVFKIGQQDVMLNYIITGGGRVTIRVYTPSNPTTPIRTIENGTQIKYAGRHTVVWDGKNDAGQYVSAGIYAIVLSVDDLYSGTEDYSLNSTKTVGVIATNSTSTYKTGFETTDSPSPYENTILSNTFASNISASVVTAENGVTPHGGSGMYAVSGTDTSTNSSAGTLECKLFDNLDFEIADPTFLSFWVYGKEFPNNGSGRIVLEGTLSTGTSLRDWTSYGQILDNKSNGINPDSMTVVPRDGKWHQYVFSLAPAAGETLSVAKITYRETEPLADTGSFIIYFDDFQLTTLYPGNDLEWYPEHLANGTGTSHTDGDCNFDMHYWANVVDPSITGGRFPWIALQVDGHGDSQGGTCCECLDTDTVWIKPSPGPGIRMQVPDMIVNGKHLNTLDASSTISWWQYDRAHALVVGAKLKESDGDTNWLYWVWNDPAKWNSVYHPGYVDMNGAAADTHAYHYNQWEGPFIRKISTDYYNEYGSTPTEILDLRVAHYCRSDWSGNKGGHIKDLYLSGIGGAIIDTTPDVPDPPPPITGPTKGGSFMSISQTGVIRSADAKDIDICWSLGGGTGGGAPRKCELYLSRDGGETFTEVIDDSIVPGTLEVLDTIIIDDTLPTVRYCWNGSYEWHVATPPTLESVMKLVVADSTGDTNEYTGNQFEIQIPSALVKPLEGNASLSGFKTATVGGGGYYLAWTTWGATDTTKRHILYLHSTDGKKWDTLATPTVNDNAIEGHRPSLVLSSQSNPQVIVYNESNGNLKSCNYYGGTWSAINLTPPSFPSGCAFTTNTVMSSSDTVHFGIFADTGSTTIVLYAKQKYPFTGQLSGLANLGSYTYDAPEDYAPSITLDKNNKPHLVYRIGSYVYYAFYNGSSWVRDSFPSDTTLEPSIATSGNNVVILYRGSSGALTRKLGYLNGTLTSTSEIPDTKGMIADPRLVGKDVVVFADTSDSGNFKVRFSQFDAEVNSFSYPVPVSDVNKHAYSPQGMVMDDGSLWLLWTEDLNDYNNIAYHSIDPLYESPVTEIDCGYAATPFTIYRAGTVDYDGVKADTGDSVTYSLTDMNSTKHHTMLLEFFYHDENVTSTSYIINCGSAVDTGTVEEGYVNQFYIDVDSGVTTIPVKVYKGDSITVSIKRIVAYEQSTQSASRIGRAVAAGIPISFVLYQNNPNPFSNSTTIRYALPYATNVSLKVYDISGRRVCLLREGKQKAGIYTIQWNGRDNNNVKLASGVYFIRFEADKYSDSKKAVILK